jgi:hypothetical protein
MSYEISDDQRLIAYTVIANQGGSLSETRQNNKLLDALNFDDELLRKSVAEARTIHILNLDESSLHDQELGLRTVDFDNEQAERLARLLGSWDNFSAADAHPVCALLKTLGKPREPDLRRQVVYDLFLSLQGRLQLSLFVKQVSGTIEEALRWASIAASLALDHSEIERIRYKATAQGNASWHAPALLAEAKPRKCSMTESEAQSLLKRIQQGNWLPADCRWLDDVLDQLEQKPEPEPQLVMRQNAADDNGNPRS